MRMPSIFTRRLSEADRPWPLAANVVIGDRDSNEARVLDEATRIGLVPDPHPAEGLVGLGALGHPPAHRQDGPPAGPKHAEHLSQHTGRLGKGLHRAHARHRAEAFGLPRELACIPLDDLRRPGGDALGQPLSGQVDLEVREVEARDEAHVRGVMGQEDARATGNLEELVLWTKVEGLGHERVDRTVEARHHPVAVDPAERTAGDARPRVGHPREPLRPRSHPVPWEPGRPRRLQPLQPRQPRCRASPTPLHFSGRGSPVARRGPQRPWSTGRASSPPATDDYPVATKPGESE